MSGLEVPVTNTPHLHAPGKKVIAGATCPLMLLGAWVGRVLTATACVGPDPGDRQPGPAFIFNDNLTYYTNLLSGKQRSDTGPYYYSVFHESKASIWRRSSHSWLICCI